MRFFLNKNTFLTWNLLKITLILNWNCYWQSEIDWPKFSVRVGNFDISNNLLWIKEILPTLFFFIRILWKFISYFLCCMYMEFHVLYFYLHTICILWKICSSKRVHNEYCYMFQHTNMMMEIHIFWTKINHHQGVLLCWEILIDV